MRQSNNQHIRRLLGRVNAWENTPYHRQETTTGIENYKNAGPLIVQTEYGGDKCTMSKNPNWRVAGTICIFVLLVINIVMTAKLLMNMPESSQDSGQRDVLPCRALPAQFVIEEPDCTDKLLKLMNITNVHILPAEDFDPLVNETIFGFQNESAENK